MNKTTMEMAKHLVSQMTIEEKMSQMLYNSPAIERLNIPAYNWWNEALHGVARAGVATMFPQAIGMAASFDRELVKKAGDITSTEGRAKYASFAAKGDREIYKGLTYWAPNVNIFRDPRWGRGHETYGEDPYLSGELGVAYVQGLQGDDPEHLKSAACAKHFAVHSGPENLRHEFDAEVNKKDLYETYLYAFKQCVKNAKVEAVMGAYNRVNGEPCNGSKTLLQDILRGEWGFEGHVVSDCWAIMDFHEHHFVTNTPAESAAMAVNNGCDLNCGIAFRYLNKAYEQGLVSEEKITEAVERLMEVRIRLGMLENYPSPYEDIPLSVVECKENLEAAVETAARTFVLMKNDGVLPLHKDVLKTIAVIGPNADSRKALVGNYEGTASRYITPLEGIQNYVGDDVKVLYAQGCHLYLDKVEGCAETGDRFTEAVIAAEQADVVVLCLGLDASLEGEEGDTGNAYASGDKPDLKLPGLQEELMRRVIAVGKPVIVLSETGSAVDLNYAHEHANAVMQIWYPGARGGKAVAEVLFGEQSPSGRLPVTFYKSTESLPDFCDYNMKGRTYRYIEEAPLYPFGYGLSYSKVTYSDATVSSERITSNENLEIQVTLKNEGDYAVHEPVQVYVKDLEASVVVPNWQLRNVEVVELKPQEEKRVSLELNPRDFALIDNDGKCRIEAGKFLISIGGQQPDERSRELTGVDVHTFKVEITDSREVEY